MTGTNGDHAIKLAEAFVPVFPCHPATRAPLTARGFYDATCDAARVAAWWREHPDALVGMPTGEASGLSVVDIDVKNGKDGRTWLAEHQALFGGARIVRTQSGGLHLYYQHPPGLRNTAGTIAPGVDVRGDGGYVIRWDCHGGEVLRDRLPPIMPAEACALLTAATKTRDVELDIEDLAAPSVAEVVALLDALPNPEDASRDDYIAVLMAAKGALDGLQARGDDDPDGEIRQAACDWAMRWEGGAEENAFDRWDTDIARRDAALAGWPHLVRHAHRLGVDVAPWTTARMASDFANAPPLPRETDGLLHWEGDEPYGVRAWLVDNVLPEHGVAIMAGQWGVGKTFAAIDLAVAVATGDKFVGRDVDRRGGVLWFAAEGEGEVPDRLLAARRIHEHSGRVPFAWTREVPALMKPEATGQLVAVAKAAAREMHTEFGLPLVLIVIDTLAAAAGWQDENSAAEVSAVTTKLIALARATNALVLVVDHYGKGKEAGVRGSSAKESNVDAVLALLADRTEAGVVSNRKMVVRKLRRGRDGQEFPFQLSEVTLGVDRKQRAITTCNILWQREAVPAITAGTDKRMLEELPTRLQRWYDYLQECGTFTTRDAWIGVCVKKGIVTEAARHETSRQKDARLQNFNRARRELVEAGWIECDGPNVRDIKGTAEVEALWG